MIEQDDFVTTFYKTCCVIAMHPIYLEEKTMAQLIKDGGINMSGLYRKKIGVLLDKVDGKYYLVFDYNAYEINEVGARIFDLCNGKNKVEDIACKLAKFYGCDETEVRRDVEEYINQLVAADVIEGC